MNGEEVWNSGYGIGEAKWLESPVIPLDDGYNEIRFFRDDYSNSQSGCDCFAIDALTLTPRDADQDLLRDDWETANGLDPADPATVRRMLMVTG